MKAKENMKGVWTRRPLGFRLFSIFYTLMGAFEYATFPMMMFLLVNVHERWVMITAIAMYFLLPSLMRPLGDYVKSKGKVFSLEELRKALRTREASLDEEDSSKTFHTLLTKVLCFRDYYYESLGQWSAFIYVILSLVFNFFALPRALNNIYILSVPIVCTIMLYTEDRIMHVSSSTIRQDLPVTEDFIRLVWMKRDEMDRVDTEQARKDFAEKIFRSDRVLTDGVHKITFLSFSEYVLVFLLFIALWNITRFSLELSLSLFVSLPVFIEGVKAVSDMSRHFLRAKALRESIEKFTEEEEA